MVDSRRDPDGSLVRILASAFASDGLFRWLLAGHDNLQVAYACRAAFFRDELRFRRNTGAVITIPGGVALLGMPPNVLMPDDALTGPTAELWDDPGGLTRERLNYMDLLARMHPPTPHVYLSAIGITPAMQQRGCGTVLMKLVCAEAAQRGRDLYLETGNDLVPWYVRLGFHVLGSTSLPSAGPTLYGMVRPPNE